MIGLFDSGIGGLTVLKSLRAILPMQKYVYLGDTARLPYGTKSPETIRRYTLQNIQFLKKNGVDVVISACHSASSSILIYNIHDTIPVLNVIEPSCREAMLLSKNKKIGLMATQATVDGGQYSRLITAPYRLISQTSPLLVPLVEAGWTEDTITEQILARYLEPLLKSGVDVIILGCTHFPLLKKAIQKVVGPQIQLVDPGDSLGRELLKNTKVESPPELHVFLTDRSPHFVRLAQEILNEGQIKITQVDLDPLK